MWPAVKEVVDHNKYELLIVNKDLNKELASSNGILDPAIFNICQLNFLRLSGSTLQSIPEEIGNLKNLISLDLQSNNLSSLPSTIGSLSKLKILDVSDNKLTNFPQEMNQLSSLTTLNARRNELTELLSFEGCTSLSTLDFRVNKVKCFQEICHPKLSSISELQASANEIEVIPAEIKCLSNLKNLNLGENKIKEIPFELLSCVKIKEFNLKGNPLVDRRFRKLVESDRGYSKTLLDYLKQNLKNNKGKSESAKDKKNTKNNVDEEQINELTDRLSILSAKEDLIIKASTEVRKIRGYLVCCIIRNMDLTGSKLKTFLSIQTKLHDTICDKRIAATMATHDLQKVFGPLQYCAKVPEDIQIHPLNRPAKMSAREFMQCLKAEADAFRKKMKRSSTSGIHKYVTLIENLEKWPCVVDAKDNVISFPPITNANETKVENETKDVLVEVTTNVSLKKGKEVMEALVLALLEADLTREKTENGKKIITVEQVRVSDEAGNMILVFPSKMDFAFGAELHSKVAVLRS